MICNPNSNSLIHNPARTRSRIRERQEKDRNSVRQLHITHLLKDSADLKLKLNFEALVRQRTIPAQRSPLFGEVSAKYAYRGCHMSCATDPYGHILGFLDRSRYFFFQVAFQLYSRGWVDPIPDPLLLRNSGSARNRARTSVSAARNSDQ
jgi:hypothetical protein